MARRPEVLSQTPRVLDVEEPRRDVLADILGASLLRNALYRRIEGGAPWGFQVGPRDRVTFYVVARGAARFEVDGEAVQQLATGDAIFLPQGTAHVARDAPTTLAEPICDAAAHARRVAGRGTVRRLGGTGAPISLIKGFFEFVTPLRSEKFSGHRPVLLASLPRVLVLRADDPARSATIAAALQLLVAESTSPGPASTLVLQRLAEVLLVYALRELVARSAGDPHKLAALADPAIHNALQLIHRGLATPWTVASLAQRVGMSRSAFAASFTALVGEPPLQYVARWRMARAGELLRDTTSRINEVAASVGYASVPSFNKAFLRWQGATPSAFRRVS